LTQQIQEKQRTKQYGINIAIKENTYNELVELGGKNDTFNSIISTLISNNNNKKNKERT
jgi:predicted CopG family antitoxin